MPDREYHRLARASRRSGSRLTFGLYRSSLWMGRDHLLSITEGPYSEDYKRFHFRDIQAITVCITNRRRIWNAVLSLLTVATFAALQRLFSSEVAIAVTLGLFGVPLLVNNIRGTTCKVYLRTLVQTEELASLDRLRKAHRILDRIRPLISTAQGQLTTEEISRRMQEAGASMAAAATVSAAQSRQSAQSPLGLSTLQRETVAPPVTEEIP